VNPLHIIFNLKGVLVGKEYFSINNLLTLPHSIGHHPTILNNKVILKLGLKEFLMRCIKQSTIYIWTSTRLYKMKTYLKKIMEETSIEIDPQRIIGQDLRKKLTSTLCNFPTKRTINISNIPFMIKLIFIIIVFLIFPLCILIFILELHCW